MRNILDNIEDAAAKLQSMGEQTVENIKPAIQQGMDKAVDTAKDLYSKAKPMIEDGIDQAKDFLNKSRPAIEDGIERAVENARNALDRAIENLQADLPEQTCEEAPAEQHEAKIPSLKEQIDQEVNEQIEKIRAAQQTPTPFSDLISKLYGNKE